MNACGIPRGRFALLFTVMLVAAAGNTAMQSLMPSIGRELGVPDLWVAAAFSLSAVLWVASAPFWARQSERQGRRALMRHGLAGFIVSMLMCGAVLALALAGWLSPIIAFILLGIGRCIYGAFGSASPPAVQAYIAARTDDDERTAALAVLASSFGLGTVIGPAIAPLFIFRPLGLSGPLIAFAIMGAVVLLLVRTRLPDDTPQREARGAVADYPSLGGSDTGSATRRQTILPAAPLRWRDRRILPWIWLGVIGGHGQAALLSVIGFLVIDRLAITLADAPQWIAIVLMVGAFASLLAQWWLIPQFALGPAALIAWGGIVAAVGTAVVGTAATTYGITIGFAIASLGFGLFRPGFTSGASLAVTLDEQDAVAGLITSVNGVAYIAAPALGVALYGLWRPLPFLIVAAAMLGMTIWINLRRDLSARAE